MREAPQYLEPASNLQNVPCCYRAEYKPAHNRARFQGRIRPNQGEAEDRKRDEVRRRQRRDRIESNELRVNNNCDVLPIGRLLIVGDE